MFVIMTLSYKKIRSLNAEAKTAKEISGLLKKDFVYCGLEKKDASGFPDSLTGFIKAIRYCCFSLPTHTKFSLLKY